MRWRRLARAKLQADPLCEDPIGKHAESGRVEVATEVHHKVPVAKDQSLALDWQNLMSVCRKCHEAIERQG